MNMMFFNTTTAAFNQPLRCWDVSKVADMNDMFKDAAAFSHCGSFSSRKKNP